MQTATLLRDCKFKWGEIIQSSLFHGFVHQISCLSLRTVINYSPCSLFLSLALDVPISKSLYLPPSHPFSIALPGSSDSLPLSPLYDHFFSCGTKDFRKQDFYSEDSLFSLRSLFSPPTLPSYNLFSSGGEEKKCCVHG